MPIHEQINAINEHKSSGITPHGEDGAKATTQQTVQRSKMSKILSSGYGRAINAVSNYK